MISRKWIGEMEIETMRDFSQPGVKTLALSIVLWVIVVVAFTGHWSENRHTSGEAFHRIKAVVANGGIITSSNFTAKWPQLVWLMSFPNSGTSYTLRLVQQVSNQTTATNYGQDSPDENESEDRRMLVRDDWINGPFRSNPSLPLPQHYILTKTHCGGRCGNCGPDRYLENYRSFQQACLRGGDRNNNNGANQSTATVVSRRQYEPHLVSKAVHLIRNPFDNIVSRFHLSRLQLPPEQQLSKYPNNVTGFQRWCRDKDKQYSSMELHFRWIDDQIRRSFQKVPCHAEFFKYVQWHNLATITITETMKLDHMILYYENYGHPTTETRTTHQQPNPQVQDLMNFLQLTAIDWKSAPLFEPKTYVNTYFSQLQRDAVQSLVQELATVTTWELLRRYF